MSGRIHDNQPHNRLSDEETVKLDAALGKKKHDYARRIILLKDIAEEMTTALGRKVTPSNVRTRYAINGWSRPWVDDERGREAKRAKMAAVVAVVNTLTVTTEDPDKAYAGLAENDQVLYEYVYEWCNSTKRVKGLPGCITVPQLVDEPNKRPEYQVALDRLAAAGLGRWEEMTFRNGQKTNYFRPTYAPLRQSAPEPEPEPADEPVPPQAGDGVSEIMVKFDALKNQFDELSARVIILDEGVKRLNTKVHNIDFSHDTQVDAAYKRFHQIDGKLLALAETVSRLEEAVTRPPSVPPPLPSQPQ